MHRLFDSIDAKLAERHLLRHPFYQAWSEGRLSKEILKAYACQYYHFVKEFPRMVSSVHANTPDIKLRAPLLLNLMDEELGEENHPALWMRFAQAIGASTEEVENTTPLPGTVGLVETMMSFCKQGSFQEGLASLYAYESQIPEVSRVKIEGLKRFYGLTSPDAVKFFSVHEEADVHHSREERELIQQSTDEAIAPAVEQAAGDTADALWRFMDGIHETFAVPAGVVC